MKLFRKIFVYTFLAVTVLVAGLAISAYLFKDRIIQQFIKEANKNLGTPVRIGKIEVSAFQNFPRLAIVFQDIYVEDSHPGAYPLLTAKTISFTLNTLEAWRGQYTIRGLQIDDSETNLRISKAGENNYTIAKKGSGSGSVAFDLKNVKLRNTLVTYLDLSNGHHHEFSSTSLVAGITAAADQYHIEAAGDVMSEQIGIGKYVWLRKKRFDLNAVVDYDDVNKSLTIVPSVILMEKARFEISGTYAFKDKNLLDLHTVAKDTDLQLLTSLLPLSVHARLIQYQSKGQVYFDMKIKGEVSRQRSPLLSVDFGLKNATLYHPDFRSRIEEANLDGSFATPSLENLKDAKLSLTNISGKLNGDSFTGNFVLEDFENPYVTADFHGELNADAILNFYPIREVSELSGRISADVSLVGPVLLLKKKATAQQVTTEGTIELLDLNFRLGRDKLRFANLKGSLQFNNNDLAMSNLQGQFENSDFLLNGFFKNSVTFLIFEDQPIGIEANLKSDYLDVDQLFAIGFGTTSAADSLSGGSAGMAPYKFSISHNLNLNFTYDIASMRYRRFHGTRVKGDLLVKGQVAVARNIQLSSMGGSIALSGIVDAKNPKEIDLISTAKLTGIRVDSLFYVFENFRQNFITDQHLKGDVYADINLEATLNEGLQIIPETLVADAGFNIRKGELNNFQPLQKLNKYLDDEGLSKLRFADLKNDVHIEHKTIYIPQMEINSNVTAIQLSGTHTFDQHIDYRIVAPLRNRKKIDPDEAFGSIEEDFKGKSKVFLKITGTTDDYDVSYDKAAMKKKIISDLKKEVQELKDAFRLKGKKKKKELELQKDEYFDWEN